MENTYASQDNSKSQNAFRIFSLLWFGAFINAIGSGLTTFALTVTLFETSQSTLLAAMVAIVGLLPRIILSPIAGTLVDRFDRRLMMILGDGLSGLGVLMILWQFKGKTTLTSENVSLLWIFMGLFISATFSTLTQPAFKASISDILSKDQYSKAASMNQINESVSYLFSPMLASILLIFFPIQYLLVIDFLTIFVTILCSYLVKQYLQSHKPPLVNESFQAENTWNLMKEGWNYLKANRPILHLILFLSLLTLFLGFIQVLITPIILSMADSKAYGMVLTLAASGMLVFSIVTSIFPIKQHFLHFLASGLIVAACMMIGIGMFNHLWIITCLAFLLFGSLVFANTSIDYLLRVNVPNQYIGRVWGWAGNISQFFYLTSYLSAGLLADKVFDPLLRKEGALTPYLGHLFGIGDHRGSGLLVSLAGICLFLASIAFIQSKSIINLKE